MDIQKYQMLCNLNNLPQNLPKINFWILKWKIKYKILWRIQKPYK